MIETIPVLNEQQFEAPLGDSIIPSVQGEFYSYTSLFTLNKPLYCLMKCKSNKKRPIHDLQVLGSEVNFLFNFCENKVELYSIKDSIYRGLVLSSVDESLFEETWISSTNLNEEQFYNFFTQKDGDKLKNECLLIFSEVNKKSSNICLTQNSVFAVMTENGKYGLFLVKEIGKESIVIDACHILLK